MIGPAVWPPILDRHTHIHRFAYTTTTTVCKQSVDLLDTSKSQISHISQITHSTIHWQHNYTTIWICMSTLSYLDLILSLLLYEPYANESPQICPFLAARPQFESVHHKNRRISSHSYSHESVIFFVCLGLIFFKLRRVCFF